MTDITIQRINQILKTVFELLWFEPQGLYVSEIIKYLKDAIPFTEYEMGYYPFAPYSPRYEVIIRVGTIPLVKAGWLEKTKNGKWCITLAGRKACLRYADSQEFFEMSIQLFQEWKANENKRMTQFNSDPYNNALEFSWAQIKQYIEMMDMKDIRTMVASLLKALGCHVAWTATNMEENYPVDIISCMDPLGINSPRLMVHISSPNVVSTSEDIDEFSRALDPNDIGIFISFGGFANKMHEFSIEQKQPLIRLIDLDRFVELWVENQDKIDQAGYSKFPLRPIHFLALPDRF